MSRQATHLAFATAALLLSAGPSGAACLPASPEAAARQFANLYEKKRLAELPGRASTRPITVRIEHSILEGEDRTLRVGGFAGLDRALTRSPISTRRGPVGKPACRGLMCRFDREGVLHGVLYLESVRFAWVDRCLTITHVELLDGD